MSNRQPSPTHRPGLVETLFAGRALIDVVILGGIALIVTMGGIGAVLGSNDVITPTQTAVMLVAPFVLTMAAAFSMDLWAPRAVAVIDARIVASRG